MKPRWAFPFLLLLAACSGPAVNPDAQNNFLTADDLVQMTDRMASSIASDPHITALSNQKPMVIVMRRLENRTDEILPHPRAEIFVQRVRALLTEKQALRSRFTFVLDQKTWATLRGSEIPESLLGPQEDRLKPEYVLKAVFLTDTKADEKRRSDYYLCTYQLTDLRSGQIIWEGSYETKKSQVKGLLD